MAKQQKLVSGATEVEFSPLKGYVKSRIWQTGRWRSASGKLYSYQFFTDKWRYEIHVLIKVASDAQQINIWAKNNTELTFYPDLPNEPTTTKTVHIVNEGDPLQMEYGWENRYEGTIILEEV